MNDDTRNDGDETAWVITGPTSGIGRG
ncbi:hypothetical protein, partial [Mesorhizobium japonicum]